MSSHVFFDERILKNVMFLKEKHVKHYCFMTLPLITQLVSFNTNYFYKKIVSVLKRAVGNQKFVLSHYFTFFSINQLHL